MIFQGDISTYHPADALMFLSQLGLNGVLSVVRDNQMLTLSFAVGHLLDAQSDAGDEKLLQILRFQKQIDRDQERKLRQIRSETGLAVRQLLVEMDFVPLSQIKPYLEMSTTEVLLELFLLESGQFNFTDTTVDQDTAGIKLDTATMAIKVLSHADEFRNFEKSVISLDRVVTQNPQAEVPASLPIEARALIHLAARKGTSVRKLIAWAPFYSHLSMQHLEKLIEDEILLLEPLADGAPAATSPAASQTDPLFGAFRQTFKTLMGVTDVLKRVEAVIGFCKDFYDGIAILTAKGDDIVHGKIISIERGRQIRQKSYKGKIGTIGQDPVFKAVHRAGIGFFGNIFPSPVLDRVLTLPDTGECALIPVVNKAQLSIFFYAYAEGRHKGLSPHHYLELLSWLITPEPKAADAVVAAVSTAAETPAPQSSGVIDLVAGVDELPPLPAMAARALEALSDPDSSLETVEQTIAQDQALVAKLIKVSNSALYGGYQKVESLRQALARLGAKTTKSLVLAASARGYFFKTCKGLKVWGPQLWQHSVESGLAARRVAAAAAYEDPEQAFIGGIMHDIGKLIILMVDDKKYQEIQRLIMTERVTDQVAETELLGASHMELGRMLMEKWHMPEAVQACAQYHHDPGQAAGHSSLAAVVAYANLLSHTYGQHAHAATPLEDHPLLPALLQSLHLTPEQNAHLLTKVRTDFENTELMG